MAAYSDDSAPYRQQQPHCSHPSAPAPNPPPAPSTLSITKDFRPYYSPTEIQLLIRLQAGAHSSRSTAPLLDSNGVRKELSETRVEQWRQLACGHIERVGNRLGFPRRTIATAQTLYHRFHLHFPLKDYPYHDVSLSALLVASKLEDTLKKLREIQIAGWQVLNILEGGTGAGEGDSAAQEAHRPNLIAIERLLLQTICFNFNLHRSLTSSASQAGLQTSLGISLAAALSAASPTTAVSSSPTGRDIFTYVLRICRSLFPSKFPPTPITAEGKQIKAFTYLAHLLAIDLNRTTIPLSYPPHVCAAACVYLAAFLWKGSTEWKSWQGDNTDVDADGVIKFEEGWLQTIETNIDDAHDICHALLDLLIMLCPAPPSSAPASNGAFSGPSPSFSPLSTLASPSEMPLPVPASNSASAQSRGARAEREKQLFQTGVPHSLSLGWGGWLDGGAVGGATVSTGPKGGVGGLGVKSSEDLTKIKIRLRALAALSSAKLEQTDRRKRPRGAAPAVEEDPKRLKLYNDASKWAGGVEGMREVEKLSRERDEREREREDRREGKLASAEHSTGEGEEGDSSSSARDKKPSSVRYRF